MPIGPGSEPGRRPDHHEVWRPSTEVFECGDALVIRVEIAGISVADLEVVVESDELKVRGERTVTYPNGRRRYYESRIRYGPFEAAVRLPFPVTLGNASAEYAGGLLSVRLPRQ
ncbi:MAG TPA: Hsp20/alpha crystallin family protein, partial [Thermomicrobiales bacterium]|nr:Hsp20/alpha crystallin family protein [Thermomicrobiales bacterium]